MGLALLLVGIVIVYSFVVRSIKKKFTTPEFNGKVVWVSGATSGIGLELVKRFAKLGATCILSSRKQPDLERVKKELPNSERHYVLPMDFSKPLEVIKITKEFVQKLEKEGKSIDIAVENAGVTQRERFETTDYENHEYLTDLNYHGPVAHAKAILPHLIKNKKGQFVIISSIAGKLCPGLRTSYVGAKHAVSGFFDALRAEVQDYGISVTQIFPGYVQTNVSKNALTGKAGQAFGKTDANIGSGITVEDFGEDCIFSIYTKEKDSLVVNEPKQTFAVKIKEIFPDLIAKFTVKNLKQQDEAMKKAQ